MHLSDKIVARWLNHMSEALASGITPAEAAELVGGLPEKTQTAMVAHFEAGLSWQKAVESHLFFLSSTERSVLVAAEASGTLPISLDRLAEKRKQAATFKLKMIMSMLYPVFIIHCAILIVPIQLMIDGDYGGYARSLAGMFVPLWSLGIVFGVVSRLCPNFLNAAMRWIPLLGRFSLNRDMADLSETLAACGLAGLKLDYSWAMAVSAVGAKRFINLGERVLELLGEGRPVSGAFDGSRWLPPMFVQQYKIGEKTGQLVSNLEKVADLFTKDARQALLTATSVYSGIALAIAFGVAIYQIVGFYSGYFDAIGEMSS